MKLWHLVAIALIFVGVAAAAIYEVRQVDRQLRDFKRCTCQAAQF